MTSRCPRCKALLKEEDNYCRDCGLALRAPEKPQEGEVLSASVQSDKAIPLTATQVASETSLPSAAADKTIIDEKVLVKAYIDNNYQQLDNGIFSMTALLFGPLCFLNRKMYRLGIPLAALMHLTYLFSSSFYLFVFFFLHLFCGALFKPLYFSKVEKEVRQICKANPEMSEEELIKKCQKQGGNNMVAALSDVLVGILCIMIRDFIGYS